MFAKRQFLLLAIIVSMFFLLANCAEKKKEAAAKKAPAKKAKAGSESAAIADPQEELKEAGLQCLLDILYKIEQDRADGNFKGNLQNDGTRKEEMKLNQLFKMGVDQAFVIERKPNLPPQDPNFGFFISLLVMKMFCFENKSHEG